MGTRTKKRSICAFGQRVGAFEVDRILRGEHEERIGQLEAVAFDGDLALLAWLRAGPTASWAGRTVDLVGQEHVGEDGGRRAA